MQVSQHFENWDNFVNKCSVCLHAVDGKGTILWANNLELKAMGYEPDEYIGRFIGDFHVDQDVIQDILARLTRDETLNCASSDFLRQGVVPIKGGSGSFG